MHIRPPAEFLLLLSDAKPRWCTRWRRSRDGPFRPFQTVCAAHQHYLTNSHHTSIDMCVAFVRLYGGQAGPTFPTKPMGTCLWVWVRVTPGSTHVDPCENPYPPSGRGFLAGTGPGTSKSTWGLPVHFTRSKERDQPEHRQSTRDLLLH
jgi:hypothetical protein